MLYGVLSWKSPEILLSSRGKNRTLSHEYNNKFYLSIGTYR